MKEKLKRISDFVWELPKTAREGMNVPARIIASDKIINQAEDAAIQQLTNVACLPGVVEPVLGMPDIHWGYGLPMGAVGVFDAENGVISSGCTGFDINCGINVIRTNLTLDDVRPKLNELISTLFKNIPSGVGAKGKLRLSPDELEGVLANGVNWCIENSYGTKDDAVHTEENGCMKGADSSKVSPEAKKRGAPQLGTLGAGNHFLEVQTVDKIFDMETAKKYGITDKNQIMIMLHCGSRGLGHQVASDYLKIHEQAARKYNIKLPDRQLVCAPTTSKEGQDYFTAMKCAVNYAFCNRLVMTQWTRESFEQVFKRDWESMDMQTVQSICHNICKLEKHTINGEKREVYVHRKGSTRSFPGTLALIAGSMGTASYILKGTEKAMEETFGSTCHGAGRVMSRHAAIRKFRGENIKREMEEKGRAVKATHPKVLAEEAPGAYKNVDEVIESVHGAGISLKVVRLKPLGVMKG